MTPDEFCSELRQLVLTAIRTGMSMEDIQRALKSAHYEMETALPYLKASIDCRLTGGGHAL